MLRVLKVFNYWVSSSMPVFSAPALRTTDLAMNLNILVIIRDFFTSKNIQRKWKKYLLSNIEIQGILDM